MDWALFLSIFGSVSAVIAIQTTLLLWMMSKLDSDIKGIAQDSNAKWIAVNARADQISTRLDQHIAAIGARLDSNQEIIMRMLEKMGK